MKPKETLKASFVSTDVFRSLSCPRRFLRWIFCHELSILLAFGSAEHENKIKNTKKKTEKGEEESVQAGKRMR